MIDIPSPASPQNSSSRATIIDWPVLSFIIISAMNSQP